MCKVLKIKKAIEGVKAVLTEDQFKEFVVPLLRNVTLTLTVEDWLDMEVSKSDKMRELAKKRWNKTCESDAKKVCESNAEEANKINASQGINLCEGLCDTHAESDAIKEMREEIKKLKEERDQLVQTVTVLKQRDQQLLKEKMELMELQNKPQEPSPAPVEEKPKEEEVKQVIVSNSTKMSKEESERYIEEFTKRNMEFTTQGATVEELKQFIKELDDFYLKAADSSLCGEVNFLKMDAQFQLSELEKAATAA